MAVQFTCFTAEQSCLKIGLDWSISYHNNMDVTIMPINLTTRNDMYCQLILVTIKGKIISKVKQNSAKK